jgi:hypothetical protein
MFTYLHTPVPPMYLRLPLCGHPPTPCTPMCSIDKPVVRLGTLGADGALQHTLTVRGARPGGHTAPAWSAGSRLCDRACDRPNGAAMAVRLGLCQAQLHAGLRFRL